MKPIICNAYHIKEKKWYWFDVLWGNTSQQGGGYIGMLPIEVTKRKFSGIFNLLNDDGIVKCNECGININNAISNLYNQEDCSVCHGKGSTTDHHDPCTECGGSGKIGK